MRALTRGAWWPAAALALAMATGGCGAEPSERSGDAGLGERVDAAPTDVSATDRDAGERTDGGSDVDAAMRADGGAGALDASASVDAGCEDRDRDGFAGSECGGTDCDDADRSVHPFAPDGPSRACNGTDDDCDGESDEGCACLDGESRACGPSDIGACRLGAQLCVAGTWTECLDERGPEVEHCNGVDDDCDGVVDDGVQRTFYRDADGDLFGDPGGVVEDCSEPPGYVSNDGDCDDARISVHRGALERCNAIDDDCNGTIDDGC